MLLQDKSIVRDVLKVPAHSKKSPEFIGTCDINGKETKAIVVAILDNETESGAPTLPAKIAWKIDEKKAKFVSLPTAGLRCTRSGISTVDGGLYRHRGIAVLGLLVGLCLLRGASHVVRFVFPSSLGGIRACVCSSIL
jgi:hypothetical protein